jgi:hypothetical protein
VRILSLLFFKQFEKLDGKIGTKRACHASLLLLLLFLFLSAQ